MSIYGGFGTRQQETQYNNLTETLISLLQYRLIAYMKCEKIDEESFRLGILNVYDSMTRMEIRKYLEPKFSDSCKDLVKKIVKEMEEEKKISEVASEHHIFIKQTSPNSLLGEIYFDIKGKTQRKYWKR
ncbi:unnamed protein product [Blepharisma stoltei]|uniref:Uncharacterized protein n=1 Tax=Blepharisma stoltei TaxID=1481888 RepID=A0AAU9KCK2_9CILI|nr:unnamed protein product [Blepharisma stoltei]